MQFGSDVNQPGVRELLIALFIAEKFECLAEVGIGDPKRQMLKILIATAYCHRQKQ
jgi:hypothetical protein